jgi:hypothetical protein
MRAHLLPQIAFQSGTTGTGVLVFAGRLLELLSFADSKKAASFSTAAYSLKLVAGVGFEPTTFRL